MRAYIAGAVLIAVAFFCYGQHARGPLLPQRTLAAGTQRVAASSTPSVPPHRGAAARSVRGALADSGAAHYDTTRGAMPTTEVTRPAPSAPFSEAIPAAPNTPSARAATRGVATADAKTPVAADAPVNSPPPHPSPHASSAANASTVHGAPPPVAAGEPKAAADLFAPFLGDDPAQVFAPASATYHAAVQGETLDPDWGPRASEALRRYVTDLFGDRFEIPTADCRQDLCELQIANRLGSDSAADMRDLTEALGRLAQQPWWDALGFDQQSGSTSYVPDGRVIALWFFSRR